MSSRTIIATGTTFPLEVTRELEAGGFNVKTIPGDLDEPAVIHALQGAWGYVLGGSERMSKQAWGQLPDLAVVCVLGTGYSTFIELPDGASPIRFTYTPYRSEEHTSELQSLRHLV